MDETYQYPTEKRVRWPGSGSNPMGKTPFGFYDLDPEFQDLAPKAASWAATRLGYPIMDVEMLDVNFYACFEESINEYTGQVNQFNIRNNIALLQGTSTNQDLTGLNIEGIGVPFFVKLSQAYGTEVGVGGKVDWKKGHIEIKQFQQNYDIQELWGNTIESGSRIEVRRIFHNAPPASARIYDPYSMTGMSYSNILNEMGFAGYSPATQFLMTPIFEDLLRMQAIEFNDMVRKSGYSFELVNNKLRIFPVPQYDFTLYFEYLLNSERDAQDIVKGKDLISDYSNVPYDIIPFYKINSTGKQWINKYFIALCKEVLGSIRQKFQTLPIPGAEVTLDGAELRQEASTEKEQLITQLRENLEATTRKSQLEQKAAESQQLQESLQKIPLGIYIG